MGRLAAAEYMMRANRLDPELRFRVDLHGVSVFGPGDEHTLIRWEWVEEIRAGDGVDVSSAKALVRFPPGAFGLPPDRLVALLQAASVPERRSDVIGELGTRQPRRP